MRSLRWVSLLVLVALLWGKPAAAQSQGPVYIVQPGDNLSLIARTFGVTLSELLAANGLTTNSIIQPGQELVIPGLEGVTGVLSTASVGLGENLDILSRDYQVSRQALLTLNHVANPDRIYAGETLVITVPQGSAETSPQSLPALNGWTFELNQGTPLLAAAASQGVSPWSLMITNGLASPALQFSGQQLVALGGSQPLRSWPWPIENVRLRDLPLVQGSTEEIYVQLAQGSTLEGSLGSSILHFVQFQGQWIALQGISADANTGSDPLQIQVTAQGKPLGGFAQDLLLIAGNFVTESLNVNPTLLDSEINSEESQEMAEVAAPFTPQRYWDGLFQYPVSSHLVTAPFGARRIFNGTSPSIHSGVDFAVQMREPVHAAAPGKVVFAGPLPICGNAAMIDHGWGVYTRYCHLSEIDVKVGDVVEVGQVIGKAGATGRVTGANMHFEVWVNGIQVNGLEWLTVAFP
ncbi:MAG: peptidoglycan DD-metalloendopeptidase family protein [Anaerolineales bacterium]